MNLKEIKELIQFLKEEEITEFELERGDVKLRIRGADHRRSSRDNTGRSPRGGGASGSSSLYSRPTGAEGRTPHRSLSDRGNVL